MGEGKRSNADRHQPLTAILLDAATVGQATVISTRSAIKEPPRPNDRVQQRGRLERSHATKSRSAGPVCCNGWFGDVIPLESNADPFVFLRLSPRVMLFARLGAERRSAQHVA